MRRILLVSLWVLIILSLATVSLSECGAQEKLAQAAQFKHGKTVWLLMPYTGEHWWTMLVEYLRRAVEADGWNFKFATAEGSDTTQYEQIITYAQQADILFVNPVSQSGQNEAIRQAEEQYHCPVVVYKDGITGKARVCAEYSDYVAAEALAKEAVSWIQKKYGTTKGKTVIALNGDLASTGWKLRADGFQWIKKNHPEINFIEISGGFQPEGWADAAEACIGGAGSGAVAIVSGSDGAYLLGALEALGKHGKLYYVDEPEHVFVGSIDGKASTLAWLRQGYIDVVYSQTPDAIAASLWEIAKGYVLKDASYQYPPYKLPEIPIPLKVKQPKGCFWGGADLLMTVDRVPGYQTPTGRTPTPRVDRNNVNTWELWGNSSVKMAGVGLDLDPVPTFKAKGTPPAWSDALIKEYREWLAK